MVTRQECSTVTKLYSVYRGMIKRCSIKNDKFRDYKHYTLKGIRVCEEWKKDFYSFYMWALNNGFTKDLTLDRINNDGNYEPSNCRWATPKEQANNRGKRCDNDDITLNGETKSVGEWAETLNINKVTIYARLRRGWKPEDALIGKNTLKMHKNTKKRIKS